MGDQPRLFWAHRDFDAVAPEQPRLAAAAYGAPQDSLTFETVSEGKTHSLLPLYRVVDQRYSIYVRPTT